MKIHILGASGSGTTTLAKEIASQFNLKHLDTDDYFWINSDPPFQHIRQRDDRISLLGLELNSGEDWVLSGSLCGWGDVFIDQFDLVIFLWLPEKIRLDRIKKREVERHGELIKEGGAMYKSHKEFMIWNSKYDKGDMDMRSLKLHESWLLNIPCQIIRIEGDYEICEKIDMINEYVNKK